MVKQEVMESWLGGFQDSPEAWLKAHPQVVEEFNSVLMLAAQDVGVPMGTLKNVLDVVLPRLAEMQKRLEKLP